MGKMLGHLTKDNIQTANKQMKMFMKSLVIKELQIKTTKRYHYTNHRIAKIQKLNNTNC